MANNLTRSPYFIDTPGTIHATGAKLLRIKKCRLSFITGTVATTVAQVQDGAGKVLAAMSLQAGSADSEVNFERAVIANGLIVTGTGVGANAAVEVYFENGDLYTVTNS